MPPPLYPPPCYNSFSINDRSLHSPSSLDFAQPKTSLRSQLQKHDIYPMPNSKHTYPHTNTSVVQHGNTTISDGPLAPSNVQISQIQTSENNTIQSTKHSSVYAYQPISGKVHIQRSTYDLRQSSNVAEMPMRSNNVSSETIDQVAEYNNCRHRYASTFENRS